MSSAPQPALLFSFNGSNVESITGLTPILSLSTTYTNGKYGQAIYFNGTPGALPATSNIVYSVPSFTVSNFTVSLWVNATSLYAAGQTHVLAWAGGDQSGDLRIAFNAGTTSGSISMQYPFVTGTWIGTQSSTSFPIGQWVHVATTITVSTAYVITNYYNGISAGSATSATRTNLTNLSTLALGSFTFGAFNSQFNGLVQDLRIYNTALSAQQIQGIYQSQGIPPSLTMTSVAGLPNSLYAWNFDGTAVDSIIGIVPTLANVNGVYTTGVYSSWASSLIYDSTGAKYGSAITLRNPNGPTITNNALYFTNTSGFNLPFGGSNTSTVSFWVKILNTYVSGPDNTILFLSRDSGEPTYYIANYGTYIGTFGNWTGAGLNGPKYNVTPVNGTWYHLTLVTTSTSSTIYLNASPGTTVSYTGILGTNSNVWNSLALASYDFGSASDRTATSSIEIDDLRFYNTALSAQQILGIYQSQGIPPSLTMVPGANTVQPSLLFSLNGTTNDSILGIQGAVSLGTTQYVTGRYGKAFNFLNTQGTTVSNYITATQSAVTFSNTAGFSMSWWIYRSVAVINTQREIGIYNGTTLILVTSTISTGISMFPPSTGSVYPTVRTPVPVNQWVHLAFSLNATTSALYLNGVLTPTSGSFIPGSGFNGFNGQILLGADTTTSTGPLQGYMQDFRMYTTALSAQQIQGIYQSGGAPPQARLTSG